MYISEARRKDFQIIIISDISDQKSGCLEMFHKPSKQVRLLRSETEEGLYQEVLLAVQASNQALTTEHSEKNIWHQRLGHCNDECLKVCVEPFWHPEF